MYSNYNYYRYTMLNNEDNNKLFNSEENITLNQSIELIKQSISDEKEDELFYDSLIAQAKTEKEKYIIRSIRDDERVHNYILRDLYYEFTGQKLPQFEPAKKIDNTLSYKNSLEKALFGEISAVKKYRKIMGTMPSGKSYNLLMSIMTDELTHADKFNYLLLISNN